MDGFDTHKSITQCMLRVIEKKNISHKIAYRFILGACTCWCIHAHAHELCIILYIFPNQQITICILYIYLFNNRFYTVYCAPFISPLKHLNACSPPAPQLPHELVARDKLIKNYFFLANYI